MTPSELKQLITAKIEREAKDHIGTLEEKAIFRIIYILAAETWADRFQRAIQQLQFANTVLHTNFHLDVCSQSQGCHCKPNEFDGALDEFYKELK